MNGDYLAYVGHGVQDPVSSVQQNLAELDTRQQSLYRARAFWLGELLADQARDTLPLADDLQELLEQLTANSSLAHDSYAAALQYADLLALCSEITAHCPTLYESVFADLFGTYQSPSPEAQGRVAYVENSYTEQAFMELTGFIKNRRVAYFHGFEDVCQEVHSGLCEYGILPVESTADGTMAGLLRLIELYDLRICALCYVPTPQSGRTAFALVRASLPIQQPLQQYCIDLLLSPALPTNAGTLITVATLCSHTLLHASTYTGQDTEQFRLRFAIEPSTLYPFLLYLLLFCADVTPIGFYPVK
jgi:hypothetical protein